MESKKKNDLSKFESLTMSGETLKGGFSVAIGMTTSVIGGTEPTNQCTVTNKANCVEGCAGTINKFICAS